MSSYGPGHVVLRSRTCPPKVKGILSYGPRHVVLRSRTCSLMVQDMSSYRSPEALVTVGPGHSAAHDRGGEREALAKQGETS